MLRSGLSTAPTWSTATFPATTTINQLLYSSAANTVTGLTTALNGVLITSAGGVPSISSTLPIAVQNNITTTGTISGGTWNGNIIAPAYGGTGINNGTSTITLGGNLTTTGAFTSNFTMTANTAVTFPTSGILLNNSLNSANIYVGSAGNLTTKVAMTGDTLITNTGDVTVSRINTVALGSTTATDANVLIANGTSWVTQPVTKDVELTNAGVATVTGINGTPISISGGALLGGIVQTNKFVIADLTNVLSPLSILATNWVSNFIEVTIIQSNGNIVRSPTAAQIVAHFATPAVGLTMRTNIVTLSTNRSMLIDGGTGVTVKNKGSSSFEVSTNNATSYITIYTRLTNIGVGTEAAEMFAG